MRSSSEVVELHDRLVRAALARTGGREVKHLGDGVMSVFVSADAAIACASSVVEACARHRFDDVGEVALKGFPQPVRAHAVADAR